jgi:hypothetical protein
VPKISDELGDIHDMLNVPLLHGHYYIGMLRIWMVRDSKVVKNEVPTRKKMENCLPARVQSRRVFVVSLLACSGTLLPSRGRGNQFAGTRHG